jgi:hypothetical protein
LRHLGNIVLESDDLHGFLTKRSIVLDGLSGGRPAPVLLRDTLYNKIRDSPSMASETPYYDRLTEDHPDRTHEKLVEFVEAVITTKRQRHNITERDALMMSKIRTRAVAVPAVPAKAGSAKAAVKGGGGGVSPPATSATTWSSGWKQSAAGRTRVEGVICSRRKARNCPCRDLPLLGGVSWHSLWPWSSRHPPVFLSSAATGRRNARRSSVFPGT